MKTLLETSGMATLTIGKRKPVRAMATLVVSKDRRGMKSGKGTFMAGMNMGDVITKIATENTVITFDSGQSAQIQAQHITDAFLVFVTSGPVVGVR
ncbi:MAG: hypothetical protein RLZZ104_2037 [Pseudomonadota bacterium]